MKEHGFDLPTLCYYDRAGRFRERQYDPLTAGRGIVRIDDIADSFYGEDCGTDAPTLDEAARWLRERLKIFIAIRPVPTFTGQLKWLIERIYDLEYSKTEPDSSGIYDTHEEALSAGITAALNWMAED